MKQQLIKLPAEVFESIIRKWKILYLFCCWYNFFKSMQREYLNSNIFINNVISILIIVILVKVLKTVIILSIIILKNNNVQKSNINYMRSFISCSIRYGVKQPSTIWPSCYLHPLP
jgi:uncharacterized metal-binding protein